MPWVYCIRSWGSFPLALSVSVDWNKKQRNTRDKGNYSRNFNMKQNSTTLQGKKSQMTPEYIEGRGAEARTIH